MILHFEDGKLVNQAAWKKETAGLHGKYEVEIKKLSRRSNPQNSYYWAVIVQMCQDEFKNRGHDVTKEETHNFLKGKFNFVEMVDYETGLVEQIPISTTRLTKERFSEYMEHIQRWAAEVLQIYIPDPNEQTEIFRQGEDY